jgi:hypothetical protein
MLPLCYDVARSPSILNFPASRTVIEKKILFWAQVFYWNSTEWTKMCFIQCPRVVGHIGKEHATIKHLAVQAQSAGLCSPQPLQFRSGSHQWSARAKGHPIGRISVPQKAFLGQSHWTRNFSQDLWSRYITHSGRPMWHLPCTRLHARHWSTNSKALEYQKSK